MRIVTSLDELLSLPRDGRVNGFAERQPVRLAIAGLPLHRLLGAQAGLDRLQKRCGCLSGGVAMLACLASGGAGLAIEAPGPGGAALWLRLLGLVAAAFVAGLAAKLLTLALTRWQFARLCRRQHRQLAAVLVDHSSG